MDETIKVYFESLIKKYGEKVKLTAPNNSGKLKQVPIVLQLYIKSKSAFW